MISVGLNEAFVISLCLARSRFQTRMHITSGCRLKIHRYRRMACCNFSLVHHKKKRKKKKRREMKTMTDKIPVVSLPCEKDLNVTCSIKWNCFSWKRSRSRMVNFSKDWQARKLNAVIENRSVCKFWHFGGCLFLVSYRKFHTHHFFFFWIRQILVLVLPRDVMPEVYCQNARTLTITIHMVRKIVLLWWSYFIYRFFSSLHAINPRSDIYMEI